jgi:glycine cleavage system transcriptional repressor
MVEPVAESLGLHLHLDRIEARMHKHMEPDVRISVYGADRAGIVARITGALAEAGLHILDMDTIVAGTEEKPIYIMQIDGHAAEGVEALQSALDVVAEKGIEAKLETIDTMVG